MARSSHEVLLPFVVALAVAFPLPARAAHPNIDAAREAYEATRFEQALELLTALERGDELSRGDLIELYTLRSLVHYAAGQREDMQSDLTALASLDPSRILPTTYPPDFREAMEAARGRVGEGVSLRVDVDRREDDALLTAVPVGDVASLGRSIRLRVRSDSDFDYRVMEGRAEVRFGESGRVFAWAELVGPGGAVIATRGSADAPIVVERETPGRAGEEGRSVLSSPWFWTIVGVVLVAAGVGIAIGVASSGETQTQLSGARFVD
jgi:hypothetical protein